MRSLTLFLALMLPALATGCGPDGTDDTSAQATRTTQQSSSLIDSAQLSALVDSAFAAGMKDEGIPGAAFVLVQNGRVLLARGFGQADVATGRSVNAAQTIFPFASISKVFTATALMQLVDRGRVNRDADVNTYLTSTRVPSNYPQPITVSHLLAHTSGLDELPGRRVRSTSDLVPLGTFLRDKLVRVHAPGVMTSYSSYGMALAGLLVQEVSGVPFETYVAQNIWTPLSMTRTFITVPGGVSSDLATAYEMDGDRLVPLPYELYQTPPASSIVGTADDMARFMIAHLQNGRYGNVRILSDSAAVVMHSQHATIHPLMPGMALGFQVDNTNGVRIIEHGGDIGGFSSLMTLLPDAGVGIFTVHHLEGNNLRFDVKRRILDRFFPDTAAVTIPVPKSDAARSLARFAGKYRANIFCHTCAGGGPNVQDFDVTANPDGTLTVWDSRWVEVSPLYFVRADGKARIGFAQDSTGRITALSAGSWKVLEKID